MYERHGHIYLIAIEKRPLKILGSDLKCTWKIKHETNTRVIFISRLKRNWKGHEAERKHLLRNSTIFLLRVSLGYANFIRNLHCHGNCILVKTAHTFDEKPICYSDMKLILKHHFSKELNIL